jgi:hypothetical protein
MTIGDGGMRSAASGNDVTDAGAPEDVGDKDVGDGKLLDDAAMADWPSELVSSRRGTLWGRLQPAVFFLIFAMRFKNGDCRFVMSGPD